MSAITGYHKPLDLQRASELCCGPPRAASPERGRREADPLKDRGPLLDAPDAAIVLKEEDDLGRDWKGGNAVGCAKLLVLGEPRGLGVTCGGVGVRREVVRESLAGRRLKVNVFKMIQLNFRFIQMWGMRHTLPVPPLVREDCLAPCEAGGHRRRGSRS